MKKKPKLKLVDRLEINILLDKGYSLRAISRSMGRGHNTVAYEVAINGGRKGYDPGNADIYARTRRKDTRASWSKIEHDPALKLCIISGLGRRWNPDEISGKMQKDRLPIYASKTAIYEWLRSVHGQRYCPLLYSRRYHRKKRTKKTERVMIPDRISIEKRPAGATNRTRYGHWEQDAVVSNKGGRGALAVMQERKSRFIMARKVMGMSPPEHTETARYVARRAAVHSITYDNGIENRNHSEAGVPTYFCDPYSSWQKGGVENANKMIRRYFPKRTDFAVVSQEIVDSVIFCINKKPRKILGYRTALEVARASGILKTSSVLIGG